MESVSKKKHRAPHRNGRLLLLAAIVLTLAGTLLVSGLLTRSDSSSIPARVSTPRVLYEQDEADVTAITVQRPDGECWTVAEDASSGLFVLEGEDGFTLSEETTAELRQAAHSMICEEVLSEDPAEYADHLADFGLDAPSRTARITFRDGTSVQLQIGHPTAHASSWYYMTMDGDDCLYALGTGSVDALFVSRESLRDVTQPLIHKARIDRITLRGSDGSISAEWALQGAITADDALDRWQLTVPFPYPAAADSISKLLANAANLRLGAYVGEGTPENLTRCGFDPPRLTVELHMAAGTIGTTDASGAFVTQDWPESTVTFTIGGERSDLVDYVLYEGDIYVSSHFTFGVFLSIDPPSTLNRYPVLTALGNLSTLTITENGSVTTYELTRTEQVAKNNELVTDPDDTIVYDVTVTRNGEPFDYAVFEAAYEQLITIRAAGVLPDGDVSDAPPHTVYTFTDVDGTVHTVALHEFGVLFDAVSVDGHQVFYLERDAFRLIHE